MAKDLNKNRKMVVCVSSNKKVRLIRTHDGKTRLLCKPIKENTDTQNKQ